MQSNKLAKFSPVLNLREVGVRRLPVDHEKYFLLFESVQFVAGERVQILTRRIGWVVREESARHHLKIGLGVIQIWLLSVFDFINEENRIHTSRRSFARIFDVRRTLPKNLHTVDCC